MLKVVQRELKSYKAKRELQAFMIAHEYLQAEFKNLCRDEKALNITIKILKSQKQFYLAKRLEQILGRSYFTS